ncbi:hypothetical protein [Streptomyces iranensis]|uniref:Uncharacterized protein n=1 Tax=Streptomyces iranensis TaxID=576784 RepID=A0A060ZSH2_9ACTN|nr:hypothetical protein [Streptomyces iranensis]MBP2060875.1 hypothetical protein [Streptomyces iranensis]CDR06336.1 predicted protein [Streptomyces iranensis]
MRSSSARRAEPGDQLADRAADTAAEEGEVQGGDDDGRSLHSSGPAHHGGVVPGAGPVLLQPLPVRLGIDEAEDVVRGHVGPEPAETAGIE